jgi:DNA repair protein RadC
MANDRFYVEKITGDGDFDDLEFELVYSVNDFAEAVDWATDYIVRKGWADSLNILSGDVYGPDGRVARLEVAGVAENDAANRAHAEAVLTIDEPAEVPREFVELGAGGETYTAIGGPSGDHEWTLYVQLAPRAEAKDDASKRYQMLELHDRARRRDDDDRDDASAKRFELMELDLDKLHVNPRRRGGGKRRKSPLTKKGERYYKAIVAQQVLAADAKKRGARAVAARTVVRAAQRGVPGLVRAQQNPPRVYRAQKVVAKLERDAAPAFPAKGMIVTSPEDLVRNTLADYIGARAHESFLVIYINVRNQVIGYSEMTSGSTSDVEVHTSGILRDALGVGAAGIVTVHNHPTGDPTPSDADRALWRRIRSAGELVGIPVVDNLVVGEGGRYFSEAEDAR